MLPDTCYPACTSAANKSKEGVGLLIHIQDARHSDPHVEQFVAAPLLSCDDHKISFAGDWPTKPSRNRFIPRLAQSPRLSWSVGRRRQKLNLGKLDGLDGTDGYHCQNSQNNSSGTRIDSRCLINRKPYSYLLLHTDYHTLLIYTPLLDGRLLSSRMRQSRAALLACSCRLLCKPHTTTVSGFHSSEDHPRKPPF